MGRGARAASKIGDGSFMLQLPREHKREWWNDRSERGILAESSEFSSDTWNVGLVSCWVALVI